MSADRQKLRAAFSAVLMGHDLEAGAIRSTLRTASARDAVPRSLCAPQPPPELDSDLTEAAIARARTWLTQYLRRFEVLSGVRYERAEQLVTLLDELELGRVSGFDAARALHEIRSEGLDIDPAATAVCRELPDLDSGDRDRLQSRLDEAAERGDPTVTGLTALLQTAVDVLTYDPTVDAEADADAAEPEEPAEAATSN